MTLVTLVTLFQVSHIVCVRARVSSVSRKRVSTVTSVTKCKTADRFRTTSFPPLAHIGVGLWLAV